MDTGGRWLMLQRVNAVAPGPVDTPQFKKECAENPDQLWLDAQATYVAPQGNFVAMLMSVEPH